MGIRVENIDSLVGVWSRRSIRWADGREDTTTRVWWVQGRPDFADIRIPAGRPSFVGIGSLGDCGPQHRNWLARQEGFAGKLVAADGTWIWKREIDYRSPTGKRDIGRLNFVDTHRRTMIEDGVDEPYTEVWERIDDAASTNGKAFVIELKDRDETGLLVAVGEHFILGREGRRVGGWDDSVDPLNVEISHGRRSGDVCEWIVADSTFPWREGQQLFDGSKPMPTI